MNILLIKVCDKAPFVSALHRMLCFFLFFWSCSFFMINKSLAQTNDLSSIQWTTGLTWEQVKEKAKKENKYIFIDAFATWCGPCKQMDRDVYSNDSVGAVLNEHFISVRVQMDKTNKDNEEIKKWYDDAEMLEKEYLVTGFPTFVFLSPEGIITNKASGFKPVPKFIQIVEAAKQPGQVYKDPNELFHRLVQAYQGGNKDFSKMPYMVTTAVKLRDYEMAIEITKEYREYLLTLDEKQWLNKVTIDFLVLVNSSSKSKFFPFFFNRARQINKITGWKGYAQKALVDKVIQKELVDTFLQKYMPPPGNSRSKQAMQVLLNWDSLYVQIEKSYNKSFARRNLLLAKIKWYDQTKNFEPFVKHYLAYLDEYGVDEWEDNSRITADLLVNYHCWNIFLRISDPGLLTIAEKSMRKVIKLQPDNYMYADTYANLLYKLGKVKQAIQWEDRAVDLAKKWQLDREEINYKKVIEKMKSGQPTWPVQ